MYSFCDATEHTSNDHWTKKREEDLLIYPSKRRRDHGGKYEDCNPSFPNFRSLDRRTTCDRILGDSRSTGYQKEHATSISRQSKVFVWHESRRCLFSIICILSTQCFLALGQVDPSPAPASLFNSPSTTIANVTRQIAGTSRSPTTLPTKAPTGLPTISALPSITPPTAVPSTPVPTKFPTREPTPQPTPQPTVLPTASPTFSQVSINTKSYRQEFGGATGQMSPDQVIYFQSILSGYTELYGGLGSEHVRTTVDVFNQAELGRNNTRLAVDYTIEWSSNKTDVNGTLPYDLRFISWMEQPQNSAIFVFDLRDVGIMIENSNTIDILNPPEPSLSPQASNTGIPSPTQAQPPSYPTSGPITGGISRTMVIIIGISGSMGAIVFATGVCLIVWARRNSQYQTRTTVSTNKPVGDGDEDSYNGGPQIVLGHGIPAADGVKSRDDSIIGVPQELEPDNSLPINDSESLASEPSMLSGVKSIESSSDFDNDVPDHLIDELDDNMGNDKLEKMRAGVEGNVGDVDEMMSQALIKALTEDYDGGRDMGGLLWGGNGDGMEIEASVLCETNDWLKRKEGASLEERRMFMQDILNRMVATVRHNVIAPERGSTAIHGAAAMLGLQLAGELPETAILVSGMRHKVQKEDLYAAFSEFGEIEGCAVAPNAKGFGEFVMFIFRYTSPRYRITKPCSFVPNK